MTCKPTQLSDAIDLAALQEKYREERDKRLRPERNRQYVEVADDLVGYYETDPNSTQTVRDPVVEEVEVAVIGGGFSGLMVAARLREAGIEDVRVIEMGGDFGGTWYWNRYPGVQCDVESYSYMPLLEEVDYIPQERYAFGPEIFEHCQRIGRHFGLYERALFGTIVRDVRWDESLQRWRIGTNRGDDIKARFVVVGSGPLNKPKLPGIPGIKDFKGHTFHTARWDYDYTGGNTFGGLDKLADKRVAIIGTGATAVQCVPHLGRSAKQLYVFQRTPSSVGERGNRRTEAEFLKSLKPGWQAVRQRNSHVGTFESFSSPEEDIICDGWSEIARNIGAKLINMGQPKLTDTQLMEIREIEDFKVMERIRRRVDSIVSDKATAEALKPYYRFLCKRPCFNDDYLPTFNRPNVTLVDVSGSKGVERITEKGLLAKGVEYEVDCIIYASGFEVTNDHKRRLAIGSIRGRDGLSLYEYWADGYKTLHGMTSRGFPNLFFTGYTQSGITSAITILYQQQAKHIAYIVREALARGAKTVEPTQEAQARWIATIRDNLIDNRQFLQDCTPSYFNNEGADVVSSPSLGEPYPPGFAAFEQLLAQWRQSGRMEGLDLGRTESW